MTMDIHEILTRLPPPGGPDLVTWVVSRTRARYPDPANDRFGKIIWFKWRRRESNAGPATSQQSAGARRRAVVGPKSGACDQTVGPR